MPGNDERSSSVCNGRQRWHCVCAYPLCTQLCLQLVHALVQLVEAVDFLLILI